VANVERKSLETVRDRKDWTVMIYMAAENSSELDAVAVEDLREMERGVNGNVHVVVQINRAWPAVPQRYEIRSSRGGKQGVSKFVDEDPNGTNMGAGGTLTSFLTWAVAEFPADQYCLVLWGHAYGLGFGRDHGDELTLEELRKALVAFREKRQQYVAPQSGDGRLELLGANACAMSYVEAAYELRDHAEYMVASQIAVPYAGWPYELILRRMAEKPSAEALGRLVVDTYVSHFNGLIAGERVTMSLLRLRALSEDLSELLALRDVRNFKDLIQKFALALQEESRLGGPFGDRRAYVRDVFLAAASGDVRPLIDLKDLCHDFSEAKSKDLPSVKEAVLTFLKSFVIHHGGHPELEDLHGVGIFAPFVTDDQDLTRLELQDTQQNRNPPRKTGREVYEGLALFGDENAVWPRLVYDELRQSAPPELMIRLSGLGASRREDRRDITQIVLAIESSFNQLDRQLSEGKRHIDEAFESARKSDGNRTGSVNGEGTIRLSAPWLKLIQPPDLDAQVATLRQLLVLKALERAATAPAGSATERVVSVGSIAEPNIELIALHPELLDPMRSADPELVSVAVDVFTKVEKAIGDVEKATRKGLTHARLGLGPSAPERFTFAEDPKPSTHGFAEDPKPSTHGFAEDPKPSTHGFTEDPKPSTHGGNGFQRGARDLRVDLAFARVVELFGQVGQSLRDVENATLELENTARAAFSNARAQHLPRTEMLNAAAEGIRRAIAIVEETSKNGRRTIRGVFFHPVFGLGPASGTIGLEERQALANAGGLSRRNLRLL
jgi:hypothetical protein